MLTMDKIKYCYHVIKYNPVNKWNYCLTKNGHGIDKFFWKKSFFLFEKNNNLFINSKFSWDNK